MAERPACRPHLLVTLRRCERGLQEMRHDLLPSDGQQIADKRKPVAACGRLPAFPVQLSRSKCLLRERIGDVRSQPGLGRLETLAASAAGRWRHRLWEIAKE